MHTHWYSVFDRVAMAGQKAAIAMVQWSKGGNSAMVQWSKGGNCNGAMVKRRQLQWCNGPKAAMVQWCNGPKAAIAMVQWSNGGNCANAAIAASAQYGHGLRPGSGAGSGPVGNRLGLGYRAGTRAS
jgi:hypothetical protein